MAGFDGAHRSSKPSGAAPEARDRRLSEKLLQTGVVTPHQVEDCQREQARRRSEGHSTGLGDILVANGLIKRADLDGILAELSASETPGSALPPEAAAQGESERFGKFIRVQLLGSGGMGEVWKSWDADLGRWVALKFLKGGDRGDIARLLREAQTAGRLSHPNIASIHEVGSERGEHYIAMEFIEGQTLETFPRKDRKGLVRLIREAAHAVALAHREGVVHRDIKPSNLIVAERPGSAPHLYVADFGLARSMSDPGRLSQTGVLLGTPEYMSPEQARGESVDGRTDVWSLGATLYELTTDKVPFKGSNVVNLLKRIMEEEPKPPRAIQPRINPDLETIILKCLEKDPGRRYATADELGDDLDRYLNGEAIQARPPSIFYRLRKRVLRRKAVAAAGAAAAMILALSGLWWFRARPEREHLLNFQAGMMAWDELLRSSFGRIDRPKLLEKARGTRALFEQANAWLEKPEAHIMRARCFELEGKYPEVLEALERSCALAPGHAEARVELARALLARYLNLRGSPSIITSERGRSVGDLRPESPAAIRLRERARKLIEEQTVRSRKQDLLDGLLAMGRGEHKEAAEHFRRHTTVDGLDTMALRLEGACRFYSEVYEGALEPLERSLRLGPDAEAYNWVGLTRHALKDLPRAIEEFNRAIELDPDHVMAHVNRGNAQLQLRRFEEAIRDYDQVIKVAPEVPFVHLNRGNARQELGDIEGAIRDFTKSLDLDPKYALAWYNRGNARRLQGEFAAAVLDYDRAIELDSTFALAWSNRGLARYKLRKFKESIADQDRAIDLDPAYAKAFLNRGNARQELGDLEGAIRDFTRAIEIDPAFAMAHYNLGNARRHSNDFRAAIQDYDRAIAADPKYALAFSNRGLARYMLRKFKESIQDQDQAIAIDPKCTLAYLNRGNARQELRDFEGAIRDFSQTIELDSKFAMAWFNRGNAHRLTRDFASASRDYGKAIELDPKFAPAYLNRGLARTALKEFNGAIADFKEVLKTHPNRWEPYYNLACTHALKGDPAEALDMLEKSVDLGFRDATHMEKDPDLETLRGEKRYKDLVERLKAR